MEKLSSPAAETTRAEWREFGLYYISNDQTREWHLYGSKAGFLRLAQALDRYAANPQRVGTSEHEHLGPHWYLTLTTWPQARLDGRGIWGQPPDFERLGALVREAVTVASPGQTITIGEQYTPAAEYALRLHLESDSFDPAGMDPQLAG